MKLQLEGFSRLMKAPEDGELFSQLFGEAYSKDRFQIYAEGFWVRVKESLEGMYPCLSRLLPVEKWSALGPRYIQQSFPLHPNLNSVGDRLPEFLKEQALPEAWVELADLEREIYFLGEIEKQPSLSFEGLKTLDENSVFDFPKTTLLRESNLNIASVWRSEANSFEAVQQCFVVCRTFFKISLDLVDATEWRFLEALSAGKSLGEAMTEVSGSQALFQSWLSRWISKEYFSGLRKV